MSWADTPLIKHAKHKLGAASLSAPIFALIIAACQGHCGFNVAASQRLSLRMVVTKPILKQIAQCFLLPSCQCIDKRRQPQYLLYLYLCVRPQSQFSVLRYQLIHFCGYGGGHVSFSFSFLATCRSSSLQLYLVLFARAFLVNFDQSLRARAVIEPQFSGDCKDELCG
jgi:hypothetical protein